MHDIGTPLIDIVCGVVGILNLFSLRDDNIDIALFLNVKTFITWINEAKFHSIQEPNRSLYKIARHDDMDIYLNSALDAEIGVLSAA